LLRIHLKYISIHGGIQRLRARDHDDNTFETLKLLVYAAFSY
jgi:hypothetical protein